MYFARVLSTFARFTDAAKRAIYFALLEANHCDAAAITPEHILAGLTWESDSTLKGIAELKEIGSRLSAQMEFRLLPETSHTRLRDRTIPLSQDTKKVLAYAVMEADRGWGYWIDCDHLLLGIMRFPNGACHALEEAGISLAAVRSASKRRKQEHPASPPPKWGRLKLGISRIRPAALPKLRVALSIALCLLPVLAAKTISAFTHYAKVERSFASVQMGDARISVIGKMGEPNYHAGKCGVIHAPDKSCALEYVYSHPFAPLVPEYYIISFSQDDRVIEADEWDSP